MASPTCRMVMAGALLWCTAACHGLLDVSNPTLIQDSDIANSAGANAQRLSVVAAFDQSVGASTSDGVFNDVALFTDERMYDQQAALINNVYSAIDVRDTAKFQTLYSTTNRDPILTPLGGILTAASVALPNVRAYVPDSLRGDFLAQIYALRGFAIVQMAEDLCPGFPINDIRNGRSYYSPPYTTQAALEYAVATLDTALANGKDSTRFLELARILKARALVDLGQYDSAKVIVADIPTNFVYQTDNGALDLFNTGFPNIPRAVGNREGGNGLPFVSANDPRVKSVYKRLRFHRTTDTVSDSLHDQLLFTSPQSPVTVATGIEARLIEAEAALHDNDPATWLSILNTLRSTAITPAMAPLTDPGSATRVDTLFKERAFWLYLSGHRLGDMRRLIHQYARPDSTVFPWGTHVLGVQYGKATSIPFVVTLAKQYNPNITSGCAAEP